MHYYDMILSAGIDKVGFSPWLKKSVSAIKLRTAIIQPAGCCSHMNRPLLKGG